MSRKVTRSQVHQVRRGRRLQLWWLIGGTVGALATAGGVAAAVYGQQATTPVDLEADTIAIDKPSIDLGRVALNVVVPVSVLLTNHSRHTVTLGKPTVETLEGC